MSCMNHHVITETEESVFRFHCSNVLNIYSTLCYQMLHWFASSKKVMDVSCVDSLHLPYIVKFLYENISLGDEKYSQNV